jgi:hypothetical protein
MTLIINKNEGKIQGLSADLDSRNRTIDDLRAKISGLEAELQGA